MNSKKSTHTVPSRQICNAFCEHFGDTRPCDKSFNGILMVQCKTANALELLSCTNPSTYNLCSNAHIHLPWVHTQTAHSDKYTLRRVSWVQLMTWSGPLVTITSNTTNHDPIYSKCTNTGHIKTKYKTVTFKAMGFLEYSKLCHGLIT